MRCQACNRALSDKESTNKDQHGNYLDLCSVCLAPILDVIDVVVSPFHDDQEVETTIIETELPIEEQGESEIV